MDWIKEVETALVNCDAMVLVMTPSSCASENVTDEWHYYLEEKKPIFLILLDPCQRPFRLRKLQYANFVQKTFDDAFHDLLKGLQTPVTK